MCNLANNNRVLSGIVIWDCDLGLLSGIVIWDCYLGLSIPNNYILPVQVFEKGKSPTRVAGFVH